MIGNTDKTTENQKSMKKFASFLFLIVVGVATSEKIVFTNETLGICNYEATCSVSGYEGVCVSISSGCCSSGTVTSGLCPGSSDIKCCTQPSCATPSGSGTCMQTSLCSSQGGSSVPGYCTGPSDVQCCVKKNPSCSYEATCSVGGYEGACVAISEGCCSGVVTSGLCPGSSDIKCCTQSSCSTPSGVGSCMQTSLCSSKGGTSIPGYCVGPSDLQCCVQGGGSTGLGVDVSTTITSSAASCLKSNGISFIVPRGYMQVCSPDSSVCPSLINAANAGIPNRDVYLYPCISKSGDQQMGELITHLNNNCKSYWSGRVWLDIEGASGWFGSYSTNQQFYKDLVDSCSHYGIRCGVYSSASQWQAIFGSTSFSYGASSLPLWYAHWDYSASFSDFNAFGGWSSPHAKQYVGDTSLCGMGVDRDYAPSF